MTSQSILRVILLALILSASVVIRAEAQQGRRFGPEQMKERFMARLDETLKAMNLSKEKEASVREILTAALDKRVALMAEARETGSFEGVREKMRGLQEETEKQLAMVLDEEEMARYRKLQEENAGRRRGRRGRGN